MNSTAGKKLKNKLEGKVYTPPKIVTHILNLANYNGDNILKKHIIDNSCGDGRFLCEICERYINIALQNNLTLNEIKKDLETYIHGIEILSVEHEKCIQNISDIAKKYNLNNIKWDIICKDALTTSKYHNKMDFVVGNPPYIRIHNLANQKEIKNFVFAKNGMTDIFITFYEIGLKMLNENGVLSYITPSSIYNSLAGKELRKHFIKNNLIKTVVNFKHNQVFDATTYSTIITLHNKNQSNEIKYYEYDKENDELIFVENLSPNEFYIKNNFYFAKKEKIKNFKNIMEFSAKNNIINVKNGFATLYDDFFIGKFDFNEFIIPIIKASTSEKKQCFFPYKDGKIIPFEDLCENITIKNYYKENEKKLKNRSLEKKSEWYGFGRSQGIKDTDKNKYAINALVKDKTNIKLIECKPGTAVYSGLYILTDIDKKLIKQALINDDFINYLEILGKYKRGGYYTFSSKDLKQFLNYTLLKKDNTNE